MFKGFFVHLNRGPGKLPNRNPRGATIYVEPDTQVKGNILVYTAWCSPKDEYNKAVGRERSINTFPVSMEPKLLPVHVANCHRNVWSSVHAHESDFYYLYKRML